MPNWVFNTLEINGEPKEVNKLLKKIERTKSEETLNHSPTKFAFNNVIPEPKEKLENGEWYEWRISNWGTKWEGANVELNDENSWEKGYARFTFDTAWSPAIPIVETLAKEFPKLTFFWEFYEESYAYWGEYNYAKGKLDDMFEGDFKTCAEHNRFGLTHHRCKMCENYLDECSGTDEWEVEACAECSATKNQLDKEIAELDEQLWEGEINGKKIS